MAYRDAFTYREDRDSVMDANDSLTALNIDQNKALNSANDQFKTQSVVLDAQAKENISLKSDVDKLERKNKFWTTYAGVMTFIAGVSIMIILK